jgi:hypothetical protein
MHRPLTGQAPKWPARSINPAPDAPVPTPYIVADPPSNLEGSTDHTSEAKKNTTKAYETTSGGQGRTYLIIII